MLADRLADRVADGVLVVSLMVCSLRSGFEGQGVDGAADLGAEHRVDAPVLLDPAHAGELRGHDRGTEMVAAAGEVGDVRAGTGYGGLDALP